MPLGDRLPELDGEGVVIQTLLPSPRRYPPVAPPPLASMTGGKEGKRVRIGGGQAPVAVNTAGGGRDRTTRGQPTCRSLSPPQ